MKRASHIFRIGMLCMTIVAALTAAPSVRSTSGSGGDPAFVQTFAAFTPPLGGVQFLCQFDCWNASFLCCNSEGGCTACFDFDVGPGRKELLARGDPDFCQSPPDSQGSYGVCYIRMNICFAIECLIEWR